MKTKLDTVIDPRRCHIGFRTPVDAATGCSTLRGKCPTRFLLVLVVCLIISGMLHSSLASAGEIEYRIVPYLWTAGIDADIGPPDRTTSADVSFGDYIQFLDIGAAFIFEAIGEKWSFHSDVMWVKLSESIELPVATADFENEQLILEFVVGFRPQGWKGIRILGGGRYIKMDTTIEFRNGFKVEIGQEWIDPLVGLEWRPRRGKWEFLIEGDIGGGVNADFTWAFMLGGAYHFNDHYGVEAGYRFMDIDFEDSEFVFDGRLEGLQIGMIFKF